MSKREQLPDLMGEALGRVRIKPPQHKARVVDLQSRAKPVHRPVPQQADDQVEALIQKLSRMRLGGMVKALKAQQKSGFSTLASFEKRLDQMLDWEARERRVRRFKSRLTRAKLRFDASLENIDLEHDRGLDQTTLNSLMSLTFLGRRQNIIITGPTGVGKTHLACAVARQVCLGGGTALYRNFDRAAEALLAKNDDESAKARKVLKNVELLVLDDLGPSPLTQGKQDALLEILEARYDLKPTVIISKTRSNGWSELLGDSPVAESITDRLISNARSIELEGQSLRRYYAGRNN